jgi:multidrug efflux pump subunit AcrA (membrane-fusion protein)
MEHHHVSRWKLVFTFSFIAVILVAVGLAGYLPRRNEARAASEAAREEQNNIPSVSVAKVSRSLADTELSLPGSISAIAEASIYARAAGYVKKRYVDIGDSVKAGQLLAELETPDLDQQVAQARAGVGQVKQQFTQAQASLVQSQAQRDIAKLTAGRYNSLVTKGAIAKQDADTQESTWKASEALVNAQDATVHAAEENVRQAQANLDRIITLQDYKNVRSPLAGVVTARNIDVGYLISASGAGQGTSPLDVPGGQAAGTNASGNEMFRVAVLSTLRILIAVPQSDATAIMIGMPARVLVNEFPGRIFMGKVTRTTRSLDPNSRTLPVQIEIPNADGKLMPGMYAQVHFESHRSAPPLLVPGDSVIAGPAGPRVAVLMDDPQGKEGAKRIHLQPVQLGRDYGAQTEIAGGLQGGETVVQNPGDVVREGALVRAEKK